MIFFSCVSRVLCYISITAFLQCFLELIMATVSKVEELSSVDRKIVVAALQLKATSLARAVKAASSEAVAAAYVLELQSIEALISRFR